MNSHPLVTVLICNYNYGRYLAEAIESALDQTWENKEILVVDDGSTDESREILKRYEGKIRIILKENGGQASAFNVGIAEAHGEIICFLDSDDYWYPKKIERTVAKYNEASWGIVCHDLQEVDESGRNIGNKTWTQSYKINLNKFDFNNLVAESDLDWIFSPTSGMSLQKEIALKVLPLPEHEWRICADNPLAYSAICHGSLGFITEILGAYRYHNLNKFASIRHDQIANSLYKFLIKTKRYFFLNDYLVRINHIKLDKGPKDSYRYYRTWCFITRKRPWRYIFKLWKQNFRHHFIISKTNSEPWFNFVKFIIYFILDNMCVVLIFLHFPIKYKALRNVFQREALLMSPREREYLETD